MIYRCKYCVKKFPDDELEGGSIPRHMVTRGTDTYVCTGSGKTPR